MYENSIFKVNFIEMCNFIQYTLLFVLMLKKTQPPNLITPPFFFYDKNMEFNGRISSFVKFICWKDIVMW